MAAGSPHEADGFEGATVHPAATSPAAPGWRRRGPALGDPQASPWDQAELEAERVAAAILANLKPRLRARSAGASVSARRGDPMDRGRSLRGRLIPAVAGLVVVLGVAIAVGSAAPGSAVPSPRPRASLAALAPASMSPVGAATPVPTSSTRPSSRPAAPAPTPHPTPAIPAARIHYKVQPGDTLIRIAARYHVTTAQIEQANRIADPSLIYSGQILEIPPPVQASP